MTPEELKSARQALGFSAESFASFARLTDGSHLRKMERGDTRIPGSLELLMEAIMESRSVRRHFGLSLPGDLSSKA